MRLHVAVPARHVGEEFVEPRVGARRVEAFGVAAAADGAGQRAAGVGSRRVAHAEIGEPEAARRAVFKGGVEVIRLSAQLGDDPEMLAVAGRAGGDLRRDAVLVEQIAERGGEFRTAAFLFDDHAVEGVFLAFRIGAAGADRAVQRGGRLKLVRLRVDRAFDKFLRGAVESLRRAGPGGRDRHGAVIADLQRSQRGVGRRREDLRGAFRAVGVLQGDFRLSGAHGVEQRVVVAARVAEVSFRVCGEQGAVHGKAARLRRRDRFGCGRCGGGRRRRRGRWFRSRFRRLAASGKGAEQQRQRKGEGQKAFHGQGSFPFGNGRISAARISAWRGYPCRGRASGRRSRARARQSARCSASRAPALRGSC